MLRALLFDIDGTLAETDTLHYKIWCQVLQEQGLEIDNAFYKEKISGRLNPDIVQDLLPQLSPEQQAAFIEHKESTFREQAALEPLDGLLDLLEWARQQQLPCAVVSNAPKENAKFMLKALDVEAAFPTVILGGELPIGKPDPLPYQEALRQLNLLATETIAFEDSPSGIQSATGAGIPVVGIASTHEPQGLKELGAAIVVKDFADPLLMQWLQQRLDCHAFAAV
ncbi:MAG TPA: HAD-IA family hydrolase [Coleofasciculaceae cyanobacterium]